MFIGVFNHTCDSLRRNWGKWRLDTWSPNGSLESLGVDGGAPRGWPWLGLLPAPTPHAHLGWTVASVLAGPAISMTPSQLLHQRIGPALLYSIPLLPWWWQVYCIWRRRFYKLQLGPDRILPRSFIIVRQEDESFKLSIMDVSLGISFFSKWQVLTKAYKINDRNLQSFFSLWLMEVCRLSPLGLKAHVSQKWPFKG